MRENEWLSRGTECVAAVLVGTAVGICLGHALLGAYDAVNGTYGPSNVATYGAIVGLARTGRVREFRALLHGESTRFLQGPQIALGGAVRASGRVTGLLWELIDIMDTSEASRRGRRCLAAYLQFLFGRGLTPRLYTLRCLQASWRYGMGSVEHLLDDPWLRRWLYSIDATTRAQEAEVSRARLWQALCPDVVEIIRSFLYRSCPAPPRVLRLPL